MDVFLFIPMDVSSFYLEFNRLERWDDTYKVSFFVALREHLLLNSFNE